MVDAGEYLEKVCKIINYYVELFGFIWLEQVYWLLGYSQNMINFEHRTYYFDKDGFKNIYDSPIKKA